MSLAGPRSAALNDAVEAATAAGITVITAAGNNKGASDGRGGMQDGASQPQLWRHGVERSPVTLVAAPLCTLHPLTLLRMQAGMHAR